MPPGARACPIRWGSSWAATALEFAAGNHLREAEALLRRYGAA